MYQLKKAFRAAGTALVLGASQVHAAVPTEVTSAMTDMKADALVVGAAFLVAVIAIAALKLMRRAI